MTIFLTGGGSGGHITPILAVAHELKRLQPKVRIVYIGQTGDGLGDVPKQDPNVDAGYSIRAGKFRRYHGEGLKQLLDIGTMLKNARDAVLVVIGFFQSRRLLKKLRPDCIFIKGGFVGVPVGLAAASLNIPYVTHDSDALPGLANRIIARWAAMHAVALPKEVYSYPEAKTVTVGVPVHANYQPVTAKTQAQLRKEIGMGDYGRVVLVTGGGLGAQRLNEAVAAIMPTLLKAYKDLAVVHTVGRNHQKVMEDMYDKCLDAAERGRVVVEGFLTDLYRYSGAADVIIARAGATNLAEFAVQRKACVIVPNPMLTGGHQLKNAAYLAEHHAVEIITEKDIARDPSKLEAATRKLLDNADLRQSFGKNLAAFARPDAAVQLAKILLQYASGAAAATQANPGVKGERPSEVSKGA